MPLTETQRQEALAEIYRTARHTVDSRGGNLHTMLALLGPELYRGLAAAELLRRVTEIRVADDGAFRAMVTGLYALLAADPDLNPGLMPAPGLVSQGSARDIAYAGPAGRELPGEHWNARILREQAVDATVVITPAAGHTEMAAHDGYVRHSHEVRPDHLGIKRTDTTS